MATVVVVLDNQGDANQADQQWTQLGYTLIDVGTVPAGFKYYETTDMTAPDKNYASKYVLVFRKP